MTETLDLASQYRDLLVQREETARRSILKDYRGVWRGLGDEIDSAMESLRSDTPTSIELGEQFAEEFAALKEGEEIQLSADKLTKVADLLLKKDAWNEVEKRIDTDFETLADSASELTKTHGTELGVEAVKHALALMDEELAEENEKTRKKDETAVLPPEKIKEIKDTVQDYVERSWLANQVALQDSFRLKAAEVAKTVREALRREVLHGLLKGAEAGAQQILERINLTMDERDRDPASDPALVRALRSEYRLAVVDGYRESLRLTYEATGKVKKWRWSASRTATSCAACWANDGTEFSVGATLKSHPHCRCLLVPVVDGAPQVKEKTKNTGQKAFKQLAVADQKAILGAKAFEAYDNGEFDLVDLVGIQYNQRFGVMLYRQSIDQARESARKRREVQKKDAAKYISPVKLIDGPVPSRKKLLRTLKEQTTNGFLVDDGASQLDLAEMTGPQYMAIKEGFAANSIRIPVSSDFLKRSYGDRLAPEFFIYHALETLRQQFLIEQAAIDKFGEELNRKGLRFLNDDKAVTADSLKEAVKNSEYVYLYFSPDDMQKLFRDGLVATNQNDRLKNFDFQVARKKKWAELEQDRPKNNALAEAFWAWHTEIVMKDFIRDYVDTNFTEDLRANNPDANGLADTIENFFRNSIEMHPLYRFLPDSVKNEMVKFGMGGVNGAISLTSAASGVGAFLQDSTLDLLVWGAREFGLDKYIPGFDTMVQRNYQVREDRKAFFTKYAELNTKEMQRHVFAYQTIVAEGLPTVPWDMPNWSAAGGNLVVQALPFIALSLATGGVGGVGGLILEGSLSAAGQGAIGLGGKYITSNNYRESLITGGLAMVQGAIGGVTNKLPFLGNLTADALTTYTFGKISGQTDDQIFQQIVLQSGFAATMKAKEGVSKLSPQSFEPNGAMNRSLLEMINKDLPDNAPRVTELSAEDAKKVFLEVLDKHVSRSASELAETIRRTTQAQEVIKQINRETSAAKEQAKPNAKKPVRNSVPGELAAKILGDYGSRNKVVSSADASATRQALAKKLSGTMLYSNGDVTLAVPVVKLAIYHIEAGFRTFTEFVTMLRAEWKGQKLTTAQYEDVYLQAVKEINNSRKGKTENGEPVKLIDADTEGIRKFKEAEDAAARKAEEVIAQKAAEKAAETVKKTPTTKPNERPPVKDPNQKPTEKTSDAPVKESPTPQEKPQTPSKPPKAMLKQKEVLARREALQTESAKRAYDDLFRATVKNKPTSKQLEKFKTNIDDLEAAAKNTERTTEQVLENLKTLADERRRNNMPPYSYGGKNNGTVAKVADTDFFGANTRAKGGKNNPANEQPRFETYQQLKKAGLVEKNGKFKDLESRFLTHAEADALINMAKTSGGNMPDEVTMYVDRRTCTQFCIDTVEEGKGLSKLTELYNIKKLTIIDSLGNQFIIRPGKETNRHRASIQDRRCK
jgi:hypothetical protein